MWKGLGIEYIENGELYKFIQLKKKKRRGYKVIDEDERVLVGMSFILDQPSLFSFLGRKHCNKLKWKAMSLTVT